MKISDFLSKDEVRHFTAKSNWRAGIMLAGDWLAILAIFWVATRWTNPLTILLALPLLAGRQLGLAVIMHECGHHTFFASRKLNHFFGQYFAANPTFGDVDGYAAGHTVHHQKAGTSADPDLPNYRAYPVDRASFKRKMLRDFSGRTAVKLLGFVAAHARLVFSGSPQQRAEGWPYARQFLINIGLAILLGIVFAPWAYLLWFGAFCTFYMAIVRIRQVAEHANVPDPLNTDPRQHTRTTIPRLWERLSFAPNGVNYHLEHHFMASVPCYRLKELHHLLQERKAFDKTRIFHGYREVLQHAITASSG